MTEEEARAAIRAYLNGARNGPLNQLVERARKKDVHQVELSSDGLHCRRLDVAYCFTEDGAISLKANVEEAGIPLLSEPVTATFNTP